MRFKAILTDRGREILERGFLPTLEKGGKKCHVLLGEQEVNFIQTPTDTDGICGMARFQVEMLFYPDMYTIASKHMNLIAFVLDVPLLLRVLKSMSDSSDAVEVKLTLRKVSMPGPMPGLQQEVNKPFLSFTCRGASMNLQQDLPIAEGPLSKVEVDGLVRAKEMGDEVCPFYVDILPRLSTLQAMVDKMKSLNDSLVFATCKNGDVHISVSAVNVLLGTQLRELAVFPQTVAPAAQTNREQTAEQQLQDALGAGDAVAVSLPLKHLSRILATSIDQLAPAILLVGISNPTAYVHLMFVFRNPERDDPFDDRLALSFKLPIRVE